MADLALNFDPLALGTAAYGDLLWQNGDVVLTAPTADGTDQTKQLICNRLRLYLGEWFLDTTQGTPWLQQVFVKNTDRALIDAALQDVILGTPGVVVLTQYQATAYPAERRYTVTFTVTTQTGGVQSGTASI